MPRSLRPFLSQAKTKVIREPLAEWARLQRWGPRAFLRIEAWKQQMEESAHLLPPLPVIANQGYLDVWFLTGRRFWYQTAFCAWSLAIHSKHNIRPVIISDGSLYEPYISFLKAIFPCAVIHDADSCLDRREQLLPKKNFPFLHRVVGKQLLFRKLTDVFCDSSENRLFLDSDMLFFRRASNIEDFLIEGQHPLVQTDCWESYGYSRTLCEMLTGNKVLPYAINIGVLGMKGSIIDWERVEMWLNRLITAEGWKYNITQCTAAMILSSSDICFLPEDLYRVLPCSPSVARPLRVMEHYVSDSKPYYFGQSWRALLGI